MKEDILFLGNILQEMSSFRGSGKVQRIVLPHPSCVVLVLALLAQFVARTVPFSIGKDGLCYRLHILYSGWPNTYLMLVSE